MRQGKRLRAKKYADIIGKVARVPLQEFHVSKRASPVKYFRGRVVKKDSSHKDCVVVRFSDGSRFYWPAEQVRSWVRAAATCSAEDEDEGEKKAFPQPNRAQGPAEANTWLIGSSGAKDSELAAFASATLPNHIVGGVVDVGSESGEEDESGSMGDELGLPRGETGAAGDECVSAGGSQLGGQGAEEGLVARKLVMGAAELLQLPSASHQLPLASHQIPLASHQLAVDVDLEGDQLASVLMSSPAEGGVVAQRGPLATSAQGADASGSEAVSASDPLVRPPPRSIAPTAPEPPQAPLLPPSPVDMHQELLGHMQRALRRQSALQLWSASTHPPTTHTHTPNPTHTPHLLVHCPRTSGWHLGRSLLAKQSEPRPEEVATDLLVSVNLLQLRRCLPQHSRINTSASPSKGTSPASEAATAAAAAGGAGRVSRVEQVQAEEKAPQQQQVEEEQPPATLQRPGTPEASASHCKRDHDGQLKGAKGESPVSPPPAAMPMPHRRPKFLNRRVASTHGLKPVGASAKGAVVRSDAESSAAAPPPPPHATSTSPPRDVAPAQVASASAALPSDSAPSAEQARRRSSSRSPSLRVAEAVVSSLNQMSRLPTGPDHSSQLEMSQKCTSSSSGRRGDKALPGVSNVVGC